MPLLAQGSVGQDVKNAQTALNFHLPDAMPRLAVDGIFGPKTLARVFQFQKKNGLRPDGIVGPRTSEALYSFVDLSFHFVTASTGNGNRDAPERFRLSSDDESDGLNEPLPDPFILPPIPRLQLTFPRAVPPLPSLLQPPRLEIDPLLLFLARKTKFELEIGQESSIKKDLKSGQVDRELVVLADGKATVWSKPIGRHLELSGGGGLVVEKRIRPDPTTETSVYVFGKAELKDIFKIGPLDLAKIEAEAQFSGQPGKNKPADLSAEVCVGPEVEVLDGKISFGTGGCVEYKTDGSSHTVTGKGKLSGTWHF